MRPKYLAMALAALDRGSYPEAKRLAGLARDQQGIPEEEAGGSAYVLGAVAAMEADTLWEEDQRRYDLLARAAIRPEESAAARRFPRRTARAIGLFLLGKSLCLSRQYDASRPVLEQALKADPQHASDIHRLAARAYLSGAHPDLKQAMAHNELYLADKRLDRRERFEGVLLQRRKFCSRLGGARNECLKVLETRFRRMCRRSPMRSCCMGNC